MDTWGGMGIGWILGAAVLAVVVWALLKSARRRAMGRGEIDLETYQQMLTDLKGLGGRQP